MSLIASLEVFFKEFVNISYAKSSFLIAENSIVLCLLNLITTIAFLIMKRIFWVDGDAIS